eukprot:gene5766-11045_t
MNNGGALKNRLLTHELQILSLHFTKCPSEEFHANLRIHVSSIKSSQGNCIKQDATEVLHVVDDSYNGIPDAIATAVLGIVNLPTVLRDLDENVLDSALGENQVFNLIKTLAKCY